MSAVRENVVDGNLNGRSARWHKPGAIAELLLQQKPYTMLIRRMGWRQAASLIQSKKHESSGVAIALERWKLSPTAVLSLFFQQGFCEDSQR